MKRRTPTALVITLTFILLSALSGGAHAQTYTQYKIQLNADGSSTWNITEVSGTNGTVDTWIGFQQKINTLVNQAQTITGRSMSVDNSTLEMSTSITSPDSKTTNYGFNWLNFSITGHGRLVVGDVFAVSGFFNQLYGDGRLEINYPTNYTLQSVVPEPDQKNTLTQTLDWLGTQFFVSEKPSIILVPQSVVASKSDQPSYLIAVSVSAVAAVVAAIGVWFFLAARRKKSKPTAPIAPVILPQTEEEKVLQLIRSNGGSAYQSAITEQCRFSKAKTSMLLTSLEQKGLVRRYKKGRDKIVNLTEQAKEEK